MNRSTCHKLRSDELGTAAKQRCASEVFRQVLDNAQGMDVVMRFRVMSVGQYVPPLFPPRGGVSAVNEAFQEDWQLNLGKT